MLRSMASFVFVVMIVSVAVLAIDSRPASGQELTAQQVSAAIKNGVDFLSRKQGRNGAWQDMVGDTRHKSGITALATLALLNSGVKNDDPRIISAFSYLDGIDVRSLSTYTVSMLAMCYAMNDPDRYANRIRECVKRLEETQISDNGGWSYPDLSRKGDASNTQFALLGLHEARLAGIEVNPEVWKKARGYWNSLRAVDDSYYYSPNKTMSPSGSMTAAAISSLVIIDENLKGSESVKPDGTIDCCASDDWLIQVDQASDWLGEHFSVRFNPTDRSNTFRSSNFYYLYALERAGRLTGQRFFGDRDWYREGAQYLLNVRRGSGWQGVSHGEQIEEVATSFALLFLSKGRRPVVIGKYRHSSDVDWDRHRKGVHFLTRALEKDWRRKLNWQSIDGRVASTNDLLETPVLFLSGRDSLDLNDEQKARLKQYVEYGRFIFAEACQGDGCSPDDEACEFDKKFRALMSELFPENPLTALPDSHPIWNSQYKLFPDKRFPILGVQTSCRTAVVYVPAPLSCYWQANRPGVLEKLNAEARQDVDYCQKLAINVIAYATGRELRDRLDAPKVVESGSGGTGTYELVIPKLNHGGGANDAPNAWENILRRAKQDLQQEIRTKQKMINVDKESLEENPVVFMHGRSSFEFNENERSALRDYLVQDGFLFADSICASTQFADSFRQEMKQVFPEADFTLERLPPEHVLFTDRLGGYKLDAVTIKRPGAGGMTRRTSVPQLEGISIDGRLAVIFSPYDLSCAMENATSSTCEGYDQDDASKIGVNILLYVLFQ